MKLEHQVTSLELSKRLKELGVKQESLWYWREDNLRGTLVSDLQAGKGWTGRWYLADANEVVYTLKDEQKIFQPSHICSAFTVAELGEMLPREVNGWYWHTAHGEVWLSWYEAEDGEKMKLKEQDHRWLISEKTEADCRSKMLIYLIENKLITP